MKIRIDNIDLEVTGSMTVLECAIKAGIYIPTLCHLKSSEKGLLNKDANCRVCLVEIEGRRNLATSCNTDVTEGMVIRTHSPRIAAARKKMLELLLSNHPMECLSCSRNRKCELQDLAAEFRIDDNKYRGKQSRYLKDTSNPSFVRDQNKCILCRRCEKVCNEIQSVGVLGAVRRGFDTTIGTAFDKPIVNTACTFCGQCVSVCPTGALTLVNNIDDVWKVLNDKSKTVIVQTAPAVRAALGEEFDLPVGSLVTGKMVTALRKIGFAKVYDTNFAADLTIIEEANEFLMRLKEGKNLPIITSCCPSWVKFIEHQFPDLLNHLSSCRSPHEMLGSLAKSYLANKMNIDPANIVVVSIMPCLSKKFEATRPELVTGQYQSVDYVLSTKELALMIKDAGLNLSSLTDSNFDELLSESTGAATIFGTTGGVIEATVRTAIHALTGENPKQPEMTALRGLNPIKEATYNINGTEVKIAVAHGLANARKLLQDIKDGKSAYHAIEIMACPGGCVGGGGQPFSKDDDILVKRAKALYQDDVDNKLRCSHDNKEVTRLYKEYLEKPLGHKSHDLLHTHYQRRVK